MSDSGGGVGPAVSKTINIVVLLGVIYFAVLIGLFLVGLLVYMQTGWAPIDYTPTTAPTG